MMMARSEVEQAERAALRDRRERIAAAVLAGMFASSTGEPGCDQWNPSTDREDADRLAESAVMYADALIAALDAEDADDD